jgi:hypothetical protein
MPDKVTIYLNGSAVNVAEGCVVSAAMLSLDEPCRISVSGEPRTAMCGMGICFECRATVDGIAHQRTCQLVCREGMCVETHP